MEGAQEQAATAPVPEERARPRSPESRLSEVPAQGKQGVWALVHQCRALLASRSLTEGGQKELSEPCRLISLPGHHIISYFPPQSCDKHTRLPVWQRGSGCNVSLACDG